MGSISSYWALDFGCYIYYSYFTEEDFLTQHVWAGYIVEIVVLFRIVWGFIGSKHAKFCDLIYTSAALFSHLKVLVDRKPQHYLGHNPAGGTMVFALLLSLSATTFTDLALYAIEKMRDHSQVSQVAKKSTPTASIISVAYADEDSDENENKNEQEGSFVDNKIEKFWEELHEFFVNFTLILVALHIGGVLLSSYIDKENLIKAMVTEYKEIPKDLK